MNQNFSFLSSYLPKNSLLFDQFQARCMKIQAHFWNFNFIPYIYLFDNDSCYLIFISNMIQKIFNLLKYLPFVSVISIIFSRIYIVF